MKHARIWSGMIMVSALGLGLALPAAARDRCYDDGDAAGGALGGAVIGGAVAGPPGAVAGSIIGSAAGDDDCNYSRSRDCGNATGGAVAGAIVGGAAAGPPGAVVGAVIGAAAGDDDDACRGYRSNYSYHDDDGYYRRDSYGQTYQAYNDRYSDGYDRRDRSSEYDRGFVDGYTAGTEDRGGRYYARAEDRPRGYNRHYRPVRETRTVTYRDYRGY